MRNLGISLLRGKNSKTNGWNQNFVCSFAVKPPLTGYPRGESLLAVYILILSEVFPTPLINVTLVYIDDGNTELARWWDTHYGNVKLRRPLEAHCYNSQLWFLASVDWDALGWFCVYWVWRYSNYLLSSLSNWGLLLLKLRFLLKGVQLMKSRMTGLPNSDFQEESKALQLRRVHEGRLAYEQ